LLGVGAVFLVRLTFSGESFFQIVLGRGHGFLLWNVWLFNGDRPAHLGVRAARRVMILAALPTMYEIRPKTFQPLQIEWSKWKASGNPPLPSTNSLRLHIRQAQSDSVFCVFNDIQHCARRSASRRLRRA
jgi:hypothetical protein